MKKFFFSVFVSVVLASSVAEAQTCPFHEQHMKDSQTKKDHHARVDERGDHEMGFSHLKTAHHFRLYEDGGAIEVEALDAVDTASRDQIREHLSLIARVFAEGDFAKPKAIHDQTVPGTTVMARLKADISYTFEGTERGGRVRISTANREALAAIHEFLRFQIQDHRTGDSLEVAKKP
ncbi:MAG: hypothetical protein AB1631_06095 [Acidobacteriota bacterium]